MAYAILRTSKLKSFGEIGGSLSHNYRNRHTPNADATRTHLNAHSLHTASSVMDGIKQHLPDKVRSNAVLCVEYLITASPQWDGWKDKAQEAEFFKRSVEWLQARHGKEHVIATSVHRDESTPHLIAYVVPVDSLGKLNARSFLGGRAALSKMQTDFHIKVKDLGLERGLEGSKAEHKTVKDFYADIQQPTPKIEKINVKIQKLSIDEQPKSPFYDTKYEHGVRVMGAVYENIERQVFEIKQDFEKKLAKMQADFEQKLRFERQKSESQREAHEKAADALRKNIKNLEDLKEEYNQFIEFKRIFPKEFDDIEFKLANEIDFFEQKKDLERRQREVEAARQRQYEHERKAEREKEKLAALKEKAKKSKDLYKNIENQRFNDFISDSDAIKSAIFQDLKAEFQQLKSQDPFDLLNSVKDEENYYFQLVRHVYQAKKEDFNRSLEESKKVFSIMGARGYLDSYDSPETTTKLCVALDSILDARSSYSEQTHALADELRPLLYEAIHQMQEKRLPLLEDQKKSEIRAAQHELAEATQKPVNREKMEYKPRHENDFEM